MSIHLAHFDAVGVMGASNVAMVYARWAHLPDRAFRLLGYMALITLDSDPDPRFWGGREALAGAIGRTVPPEPAKGDSSTRADELRKMRRADFEAVKSGIRDLVDKGAVRISRSARPGRNAEYQLLLGASMGQGEPVEQGRVSLSMGQGEPVNGAGQPYPRGELREEGTQQEDESSPSQPSPRAKLTYPQAHSILSKLPDLGATYLEQADGETLMERVVAAAVAVLAQQRAAGAS